MPAAAASRITVLGALVLVAAAAQAQSPDDALEKAKRLTVMINATVDGDTRPGAGIIFGLANDQIYIATANHLVRHGPLEAGRIEVEFRWLPGQPLPAQLLTDYDDRALDLAVIAVDRGRARLPTAGLPPDQFGDAATLTRSSPVSAIGYPNGTAYDVSSAQISQVEAVVLKYRVPGLVPGGYSGGPLIDRNGRIVGMIRQDQPPDGEATRFDLLMSQLKVWNYHIGFDDPATDADHSTTDSFRDILRRYIAEAPSGFRALGAKEIGNWNPSVNLPEAVSCRGGRLQEPFIECVLYRTTSEAEAGEKFEDLIGIVQSVLPGWNSVRLNLFNAYLSNTYNINEQKVNVNLGVSHSGDHYDVILTVVHVR